MPRELDESTLILDSDTEDDLETQIQGLKIDVPPLGQGRTTDACEQWQIQHLLAGLLAACQLVLPVRLYKREAPDFVLQNGTTLLGIETIQAINCDYVQAQVHPAAQRDDAVVDPSLYKWGTQGRPRAQIREEAGRTQPSGHAWPGDSVEHEFAQSIKDVVFKKHDKLNSHYSRFDNDWILIYHNQHSPQINIDKAQVYTADILVDYWKQRGFDTVYVHKYNWILSFTRDASEIVYEFPQSDVPFGIDENIWEHLESAEKTYLKLLEEEASVISHSSISELEPEPGDLFGCESELQALRLEWLVNRDRDLERVGCGVLLQPPDRFRLRTASEVAALPAALELFRGGVLEHVFRTVAESIHDPAVITALHQTMACRGPEFSASVVTILGYLSRFGDVTHWAADSQKCSAILQAVDPDA